MISSPVILLFMTDTKYTKSAISSGSAHLSNNVSSRTALYKFSSFKIWLFNSVITPHGDIELVVALYFDILKATFFIYANTPPLEAT